jgi:uncharacterized membrane protein
MDRPTTLGKYVLYYFRIMSADYMWDNGRKKKRTESIYLNVKIKDCIIFIYIYIIYLPVYYKFVGRVAQSV